MAFKIERFNVLAFEPESVSPGLKISGSILRCLEDSVNRPLESIIAGFDELTGGMTLAQFAAFSTQNEIPGNMANMLDGIPEDRRFMINVDAYNKIGVPRNLADFNSLYRTMEQDGIHVVLFNTASMNARGEYQVLAKNIREGKYPALDKATWIATTSLHEPMPSEFLQEITKRGKTNGRSAAEMTRIFGSSYLEPIGDSIVMSAQKKCTDVILNRLKCIKEMGQLAYPTYSNGGKNGTRTNSRFKNF